eukprot:c5910_g1_i1 orf=1-435(-)
MKITLSNVFVSITLLFHQVIFQLATCNQGTWHGGEHHVGQVGEEAKGEKRSSSTTKGSVVRLSNGTEVEIYPMEEGEANEDIMRMVGGMGLADEMKRRKLSPFGVCSVCKCCDGTQTVCMLNPCCYSIVCNDQPFGLCSLSPSSC